MNRLFLSAVAVLAILTVSCKKEEKEKEVAVPDIDWSIPSESVLAGKAVSFTDNSLDVQSRTWTFQDGNPATSTDAVVSVTFTSAGEKAIKLEVVFKNGKTNTKEAKVNVFEPLEGEISVNKTTAMGCIRIGEEVTFSLDNASGNPDSYAWTFDGGKPATSSEAAPKVTFDKHIREMHVTCTVSRSDGAKLELEKVYEVGNYTLNRTWPEVGYDGISFEEENAPYWICWISSACNDVFSVVEGGACGTAHSMKIDATKIKNAADQAGWGGDIFPRDSWGCNVPKIEKGKNYELSFWMKSNTFYNPNNRPGVTAVMIVGWLEDWMNDPVFGTAVEAFEKTMGIPYEPCGNRTVFEFWPSNGEEAARLWLDGENWTNIVIPFTSNVDLRNVYPYLRIPSDAYEYVLIDEIEICLVEE